MEKKVILRNKTKQLIDEALKIKEEKKEARVIDSWWNRKMEQRRVGKDWNKFKKEVDTLEFNIEIFKLELDIANLNPLVFWFKLFAGIVLSVVSLIWWL